VIRALAIGAAVSVVVVVVAVSHPFQPDAAVSAATPGDVTRGTTLFAASCAGCHAADGTGGVGPNITQVSADAALAKIAAGGGVMPAGLAKGQDAADIAAFVDSLDAAAPAPAATTAAPATTAAAPATTAAAPAGPSPASQTALTELKRTLRTGQSQIRVLVQHTKFLETALAEDNVFNVRFHAEHLANIVRGEPIRDLDGNGEASNPGDGVGLAGPNGGYVTAAGRLFTTIGADAGVSELDRGRAERASASVAFMIDRMGTIVAQAERAAKVATAADARAEIRRIRAAVDDVAESYKGLRGSLADYEL
jgi:mono/diheme cytochrome c family protein